MTRAKKGVHRRPDPSRQLLDGVVRASISSVLQQALLSRNLAQFSDELVRVDEHEVERVFAGGYNIIALSIILDGTEAFFDLLLSSGKVDINKVCVSWCTPIMLCLTKNRPELFRKLWARDDLDPNVTSNEGDHLLCIAANVRNEDAVKTILWDPRVVIDDDTLFRGKFSVLVCAAGEGLRYVQWILASQKIPVVSAATIESVRRLSEKAARLLEAYNQNPAKVLEDLRRKGFVVEDERAAAA